MPRLPEAAIMKNENPADPGGAFEATMRASEYDSNGTAGARTHSSAIRKTAQATLYRPPPPKSKWQMFAAAGLHGSLSAAQKSVLVCLIDHANPKTGRCDPSQARIAAMTGMSPRAVKRAIAGLVRVGLLAKLRRAGPGMQHTNSYGVNWETLALIFAEYQHRGRQRTQANARKTGVTKPSPGGCQNRPLHGDKSVPLTRKENQKIEQETRMAPISIGAPSAPLPNYGEVKILERDIRGKGYITRQQTNQLFGIIQDLDLCSYPLPPEGFLAERLLYEFVGEDWYEQMQEDSRRG
jgi:hypothetical protein